MDVSPELEHAVRTLSQHLCDKNLVIAISTQDPAKKELFVAQITGCPIHSPPLTEDLVPMEWKGYKVIIRSPVSLEELGIETEEEKEDWELGGDWWKE